jgi:hypothetical protein
MEFVGRVVLRRLVNLNRFRGSEVPGFRGSGVPGFRGSEVLLVVLGF